ncbi:MULTISPECIES: carboxymuconolactone decarboxylase family protein [Leclercia]|uniref:carboxymuconolactone decarboxylase family protein n=1 Tax=Leclercia TaxID=83654 RepID=UPI000CDC1C51|nr:MULTISPECIES: carboxymuconolactone decarboxylase family protein [Leclercia]POW71807.1 carboxymuconolactone decarboxylase family protein [Leclercia sp. LSNIH4]AUY41354.1 carboxymuconolactone decarboxylase family protein [Leclercia sp. LSNIH3]MDQ2127682.1 carboxymuconolactone decarboxylase family protein [Leclercia adecarboxylata]MDV7056294.1 carboxymuconolactone decarboxylase family protein [Leclercia adecarboxylata]QIG33365.1 carboxymuconolactone decarboxylase family protein [Leclercia adec
MTTPRVTPWQDGEPFDADLLNAMKARRPGGELIGIDRILLKSFPLATGWNELMVRVRQQFSLSLEYRELIMLRVASLNKAEFEWNVHYPAYLDAGGTAEKAAALEPVSVSSLFNETETLLIRLTDQSTHGVVVDADIIDELKRRLGEKETVEAVATVAAYNMVSRFLVALAI